MDFREKAPCRRKNPSRIKDATEAKVELREDFHCRCGYCDDHDFFRLTYYEVDHFVPKSVLKSIPETAYDNLVYSCRSCNNAKRNKWPTGDETRHNDGVMGFIDPCDEDYARQFSRMADGSIIPKTKLGEWMWNEMNLGHPSHHIIRQLEQLKKNIDILLARKSDDADINRQIAEMAKKYMKYEEELKGTPAF